MADKYANQATITVVESAANTLTFKKLETGVSLFEKQAWLISRVEYFHHSFLAATWDGNGDKLQLALTAQNNLSSLALTDPSVLDLIEIVRADFGAAAVAMMTVRPLVKDLSTLQGGGILVPPNPIYAAAVGTGLAGATTSILKLFYTTVELKADEYWELVESRRIISS